MINIATIWKREKGNKYDTILIHGTYSIVSKVWEQLRAKRDLTIRTNTSNHITTNDGTQYWWLVN